MCPCSHPDPSQPPPLPLTAAVSLLPLPPSTHAPSSGCILVSTCFSLGPTTDRRACQGWDRRPRSPSQLSCIKVCFFTPNLVSESGSGCSFYSMIRKQTRRKQEKSDMFIWKANVFGEPEGRKGLLCSLSSASLGVIALKKVQKRSEKEWGPSRDLGRVFPSFHTLFTFSFCVGCSAAS